MTKIAEVNLSGLKPDTVLTSSQPLPPFESIGFQKAREIQAAASQPKTAASRHAGSPATLPQIEKLLKKTKDEDTETSKAKRLGGHMLAGGGGANFLAKAVNNARNVTGFHPPKPGASKLELGATVLGMSLGAAELRRKRRLESKKTKEKVGTIASPSFALKASSQIGKAGVTTGEHAGNTIQQQIRKRLIGTKFVSNALKGDSMKLASAGEEELYQAKSARLTREDNKALAHALFGKSYDDVRKKELALVAKLFVQAPVASTMAPVLEKQAISKEFVERAAKSTLAKLGPQKSLSRARKFSKSMQELQDRAMGGSLQQRIHGTFDEEKFNKAVRFSNRADEAAGRVWKADSDLFNKKASITPALDAFLEKNAMGLTEAQLRYPELLTVKTAAGRSGEPTSLVPNLGKKATTPTSGPNPTKSSLSGGAA